MRHDGGCMATHRTECELYDDIRHLCQRLSNQGQYASHVDPLGVDICFNLFYESVDYHASSITNPASQWSYVQLTARPETDPINNTVSIQAHPYTSCHKNGDQRHHLHFEDCAVHGPA